MSLRRSARPTPRGPGLRRLAALLFGIFVLSACGEEPPPPPPPAEANVVAVENAALPPDARLEWRIDSAPRLSIGGASGRAAHQLFGVRDATVLPDGRVAVANGGTGEIRVFDATGTHVISMGGAGEGPGEFRALAAVEAWPGDSILAWDARQRRISVFSGDGRHGRTFRLRTFEDTHSPQFLGVTPDRRLLVRAGFPQRGDAPYEGMFRPDHRYALLDATGAPSADLGTHPGEEGFLIATGGFESFSGHPHGKYTVAAVWGDEILISPNDDFTLRAFAFDGRPTRVIRLDLDAAPPTGADMESWFDAFTANDTPEERRAFRETFESFPLLESVPAFTDLVADALGFVWVRAFGGPPDGPGAWIVFDPEGKVVGRVETPSGLDVYEIGADYVLGRVRDELDIESVQLRPLER